MIVIKLQGGLGNQMFQYAFARVIAKNNRDLILIENSFFENVKRKKGFTYRKFELDIFDNYYKIALDSDIATFYHLSIINKLKKKTGLCYPKIYNEPSFDFQINALSIKSPVYLEGYFQSYKYFKGNEVLIKEIFTFPVKLLDRINKELLFKLKKHNTIAVHIRRGDYINDKVISEVHGNCGLEYYLEAIKRFESNIKDFTIVFFSDDINWVKEHFDDLPYSKIFVDNNKNDNSWKDMLLMSSCSHNIIANSSFSWWGAWLNSNPEKVVIAPKKWFAASDKNTRDLIPSEWIQI